MDRSRLLRRLWRPRLTGRTVATALAGVIGALAIGVTAPTATLAQVAPPAELISVIDGARVRDETVMGISGDGRYVAWQLVDPSKPTRGYVTDRVTGEAKQVPDANGPLGVGDMSLSRGGCHVGYWANSGLDGSGEAWVLHRWNHCTGELNERLASDFSDPPPAPRAVAIAADGDTVAYTTFDGEGGALVWRQQNLDAAEPPVDQLRLGVIVPTGLDISDDGSITTIDVTVNTVSNPGLVAVPTSVVLGPAAVAVVPGAVAQPAFGARQVASWQPGAEVPTKIVSARIDGSPGMGDSFDSSISGDGRFVAFSTFSIDVVGVGVDFGSRQQVVVRDLAGVSATLVSETAGVALAGNVGDADMNTDGSKLALTMVPRAADAAQGFAPDDRAVYVAAGPPGLLGPITLDLAGFGVDGRPVRSAGGVVSADGRVVAFDSREFERLVGAPPGNSPTVDVWVRERIARLTADPNAVGFGAVGVGAVSATRSITIRNVSDFGVAITAVSVAIAPFEVVTNTCSGALLAPGATCAVGVRFRPSSPGATGATVRVAAGVGAVDIALTGTGSVPGTTPPVGTPGAGALRIEPEVIDFGTTLVGTPVAPRSATVRNTGTAAVTVSSTSIGGTGADRFVIVTDGCRGTALAPGATCAISLSALVDVDGTHAASLTVAAGAVSATNTLRLAATFEPTLTMSPAVVRPGEVTTAVGVGFPANATVELLLDGTPWMTAVTDASGGLRRGAVLLPAFVRVGAITVAAVDQPTFAGVEAPLLINPETFRPSGFDGALAGGVRTLYARGG